ncbi:flagellar motor protein MotB [Paenibacillus pasadenensis]|uniref:Flagellar motor rotation protein MotB n=1 Tax=Paenibacillus pasadenensis TaxID=217090 RepID=A0A2N5MZX5_9BACL|nr:MULTISPECIES: flagellar motor protein MotB [Paenibacillus]PLT43634.1 Flagellar motor rotation protein MotB [Paenibacillus pasadenensis]QGG54267.1 flagellar motor protein MotB [Paenibacillus sp. B01]
MSKKHKHEEHEEHVDESWLIPYADLLTLLLALFIVLYASSSVDAKKFEEMSRAFNIALSGGNGVLESYKSIDKEGMVADEKTKEQSSKDAQSESTTTSQQVNAANLDKAMQELMRQEQEDLEKLKKQVDQYIEDKGLTTSLETKLNQSRLMITISDKALFPSGSATIKPEAEQLGTYISGILQKYPNYEVMVSGHTDNQPISNAQFRSNWDLSTMRAVRFMDVLLHNDKLDPKRFSAVGNGEYEPVASNDTAAGRAKNRRVEVSIIRNYGQPSAAQMISAGFK